MGFLQNAAFALFLPAFLSTTLFFIFPGARVSRLNSDHAPKTPFGFVQVDGFGSSGKANGVDIIFVHGLGSNPDTTWSSRVVDADHKSPDSRHNGSVCWVQDFLPHDIAPRFRDDVRVFFYNHDTHVWRDAPQSTLDSLGSAMLSQMQAEIRRTDEEWTRKLIFVGYSYGGLIIKEALVQASSSERFVNIARNAKAFVFLGTPHRGSKTSWWGHLCAYWLRATGSNPDILHGLHYDSEDLHRLQKKWLHATSQRRVVNFYEERETPLFRHSRLFPSFLVEPQSATYESSSVKSVENIPLPLDHYGLNKFSKRDTNYKIIKDKLNELLSLPLSLQEASLYSVPLKPISNYVERHPLSMDIERKLRMKHENSSVPFAVSIHGLGGTGKSQLALRYIEMHKHEFDTVFWIDARDEESTHHCFQTFAKQLRMPTTGTHTRSSDPSASGATQYVLQWFKKRRDPDQRWLVVVDNADDVRWGVKSLIPQGVQGSIIITSQDSRSKELIDGSCEQVEVGTMESSESELLLLKHLGLHSDYISDQMRQDCVALINRLGFLAIALDLAGAFIGSRNGPREQKPRQYIRTFDEYQDEILQNEDSKGLSFTDKTVWTVWNTVLSNIDSYSSGVKPTFLLAFLAHFKGSIVQDSIFRLASLELDLEPTQAWQKGLLPQELAGLFTVRNGQWRSFQYNSTIDTLARYHLIQKIEGEQTGITMHSLVKWRALMHMPKLPWHQWNLQFLLKASSYVQKAKKDRFFPDWYISDHLLVVEDYLAAGYSWQTEARIRQIVGHIYSLMGDYSHCERVLAPVLGIFRAALLSDDVIVEEKDADVYVQALSDLASASRYHGNLDEAEELGFHALEMYAQYKGIRGSCNDPSMTETMLLSNLAVTYMEQGRFEEAQALQMASLKGDSKGQQNNQHNKLTMKANLAKTYLEQGRLEEARNLATETLKQSQALGGDDNSNTIYLMHILASSFIREGLYDEAEGILTPAFEISRRVTGSHGPWHANLMASLAEVYRKQKRYLEAKQLMTSILEIKKDTPGLLNPDTLNWTRKLAYTQLLLNESREARQLLLPVLKTSKEELGLDSPDTVELLVLLFVALIEQSQHESATDLLELPPKVWKMMWENDDFTPASLMVCVSAEHITQGRFHQAERLSSQALNLSRKALGPEHRDTFRSTENLVAALIFQGKCHLAQDLGNEALEHSDRLRGPEHPGTLLLMRYLETAFRISKVGPEYELDMLSILHHPDSTGLHIARCDW